MPDLKLRPEIKIIRFGWLDIRIGLLKLQRQASRRGSLQRLIEVN